MQLTKWNSNTYYSQTIYVHIFKYLWYSLLKLNMLIILQFIYDGKKTIMGFFP